MLDTGDEQVKLCRLPLGAEVVVCVDLSNQLCACLDWAIWVKNISQSDNRNTVSGQLQLSYNMLFLGKQQSGGFSITQICC